MSDAWWVVAHAPGGRGQAIIPTTRRALAEADVDGEVRSYRHPDEAAELVQEGVRAGFSRFGSVGGDTALSRVCDTLLRHPWPEPPIIGILPAGAGCDFARVFGLPQAIAPAARHLRGDEVYLCDAGLLEGEWGDRFFVNVAHAGLGAAAARWERPRGSINGRTRLSLWLSLPLFGATTVDATAGGRTFSGRALAVVLANGQFFAGGMNVAPKATLISGKIDLQVFGAKKSEVPGLLGRIRRGMHLRDPAVRRLQGSEFAVATARPWPIAADGEYLGRTPLRGRIVPGAFRVKI